MSKNRVPIVDKNGKSTHVWKSDDNGRHSIERIAGTGVTSAANSASGDPVSDLMDDLWTDTQAIRVLSTSLAGISEMRKNNQDATPLLEAVMNTGKQSGTEMIMEAAFSAQDNIEKLDAELTAIEQQNPYDLDEEDRESYDVGVGELRLQKSQIKEHLDKAGVLSGASILSPRITRTWEDGIAAAKEIYGEPTIEQDLPNGGSTLRYGDPDADAGWHEVTVNRLGNVTAFNTPEGSFSASSIDFPVATPTGDVELRGETEGKLTMQDVQRIVFISTCNRDTWTS